MVNRLSLTSPGENTLEFIAGRIPNPTHHFSDIITQSLDNMRISAIHIILAVFAGAWAAPSVSTIADNVRLI